MRICLISREYPPETGWGGIATFTRHLAHGLKDLGHEVVVVSLSKDTDKVIDDEGVTVHRVEQEWMGKGLITLSMCMPYSRYVLVTSSGLWRKFYELHCQKEFDVVDTPELLAEGFYPALTRILPLVIRLYTPHSKFIAEGLHNVTPSFDHEFIAALERVAMLSCDVITSPSDDLADFVANDLNYDRNDIHIVRNPIDPNSFTPDGPRKIPSDDKLRVLFVGRLEERKGIHYLIDAIPQVASRHPNVEFVVIGDDTKNSQGQKSVLADLKSRLKATDCTPFVTFIGRIPLEELPSYYRSADVCIVPSLYDNSPYTCLEAMACGRAVIGTTGGGTKEYIVDGESGILIEPKNSQAIADALDHLLSDEKKRNFIAQRARAHVLENFQRKEIARQTEALYRLAQRRFAEKAPSTVYKRPTESMLNDATYMMRTFDQMIYNMLYQYSYRFRIMHWVRIMKHRPKLFLAKTTLKVTRLLEFLTGRRVPSLNKFNENLQLETQKKTRDKYLSK